MNTCRHVSCFKINFFRSKWSKEFEGGSGGRKGDENDLFFVENKLCKKYPQWIMLKNILGHIKLVDKRVYFRFCNEHNKVM